MFQLIISLYCYIKVDCAKVVYSITWYFNGRLLVMKTPRGIWHFKCWSEHLAQSIVLTLDYEKSAAFNRNWTSIYRDESYSRALIATFFACFKLINGKFSNACLKRESCHFMKWLVCFCPSPDDLCSITTWDDNSLFWFKGNTDQHKHLFFMATALNV